MLMSPPQQLALLGGEGEVPAQEVAYIVTENYAIYRETAARLEALQKWVKEMSAR